MPPLDTIVDKKQRHLQSNTVMSLDTIADKTRGIYEVIMSLDTIVDKKQMHLRSNNVIGHNGRQETGAFTKL